MKSGRFTHYNFVLLNLQLKKNFNYKLMTKNLVFLLVSYFFFYSFSIDQNQRILVHNHDNLPITSIENISEANFSQEIHNALAANK